MPLNRNLPNNRTNDSLLITMTDNLKAITDIANCVDTGNNVLNVDVDNVSELTGNLALESTLSSLNDKISKGNSATAVDGELQQVLIYGKKPDNTLQPLETSGDRLLVDVLELAASGKISTSTALSAVQVCGYDTGTSQFKTINVDGSGNVQCDIVSGTVNATVDDVLIVGNDGNDGSGTDRVIKTDANGAVIVDPSKEGIVTSDGTTTALHTMMLGNNGGNLRTIKVGEDGAVAMELDYSWDNTNEIFTNETVADGDSITSSNFDLGQGVSHDLGNVEFFHTNSNSVFIDVSAEVSPDGTNWYSLDGLSFSSSKQYVSHNQEEVGISIGHRYMRLVIQNNDGLGNSTNITTKVAYYK